MINSNLTLNDVEDLLNEKCEILLTQVQRHNNKLKEDIRKELAGIQREFNDAVKELVTDISEIEKATDRKTTNIYKLIEEFKGQSRKNQSTSSVVIGKVEQNNSAYYINTGSMELKVSEPLCNDFSTNLQRELNNRSWDKTPNMLKSREIKYITEFDGFDSEYEGYELDCDDEKGIELPITSNRSGKAIIAKYDAWDVSET